MKSILITGGYGFIGRNLALELSKKGNKIFGIGRGSWNENEALNWGFSSWFEADITIDNLNILLKDKELPNIVYNCAGSSSVTKSTNNPNKSLIDTVLSCSELLEWLRTYSNDSKTVFVSSAAVYGSEYERPILNSDLEKPISTYGIHKLMSELLCKHYAKQYSLEIVIPRIFSVYGVGLKKQLIWDFCEKVNSGNDIKLGGTGEEKRDWIEIRDLVNILSSIPNIASTESPTVNIGSGKPTSVNEIINLMNNNFKKNYNKKLNINFDGNIRPGNPNVLIADLVELQEHSVSSKISLKDGIFDYISWYMSRNKENF